jgi:hypothetical protein
VKVSSLVKREEQMVVRVDDTPEGLVHVTYRPGAMNLEIADKIKDIQETGYEFDIASAMLEPILVNWDLENDDGTPFPLTPENLRKVPLSLLGLILQQLQYEARPLPMRGEISPDISPPTEESEAAQNGTSSPEQQGTGESLLGS